MKPAAASAHTVEVCCTKAFRHCPSLVSAEGRETHSGTQLPCRALADSRRLRRCRAHRAHRGALRWSPSQRCRPLLAPSIMFRIHEISVPSASEEYEDDKGDYSNTFSVHRTDDSIISGTGWSSFYRDHVIGSVSWNSLGDGYYTHQETEELAELVSRERLEQDNIERSTEHVRRWIQ